MKKKKNKKIQKSKILNFNFKNLGNDITQYPFVEIKWLDIEGDRLSIKSGQRYNKNIYRLYRD